MPYPTPIPPKVPIANNEEYNRISENKFKEVVSSPLSTFSTDVDTASYANVRRFLNDQQASLPPKNAVRIEELINYFSYDYKVPQNEDPFYINTHVGNSIWNNDTKIIEIALQTKKPNITKLPASNLVFLLDVSGSMGNAKKLPLLKKSLKLLVKQLRAKDSVSIVVYAGSSGLVLDKARGDQEEKIIEALNKLNAGGSTAGGAGIRLAYKVAKEAFIENGNNRVILATDGDFNVGQSSQEALVKLIKEKREDDIFLTVLGFGMGNYKDGRMEQLADKGNGNYAYIDNLLEAKKVLVTQMNGTLHTVAKDVKVQVEFNPNSIHAYRLIGYENRTLANKDFNDDKKDAAEIGMGHSVTALYEVVLASKEVKSEVDSLKYQRSTANSNELATVKIRYKKPTANVSTKMQKIIHHSDADINQKDFNFAQTVAGFGMLLRDSEYKNSLTFEQLIELAKDSKNEDREGYRAEFIKMMEKAQLLK
ncbi:MAG: Von Willebrand factor type A domain protein [uncultured Sulfurovum sp.]|uniref:von Willebrand factor type A domain protein n=1 Tax=uncultured Sulfurovum sp. TaxID=269237 RepID=A0A6S6TYY4_9BACT|nr:MAG: Von Willebrand factor type A domain protein [uncultured Sulfurovum sp.]